MPSRQINIFILPKGNRKKIEIVARPDLQQSPAASVTATASFIDSFAHNCLVSCHDDSLVSCHHSSWRCVAHNKSCHKSANSCPHTKANIYYTRSVFRAKPSKFRFFLPPANPRKRVKSIRAFEYGAKNNAV